MRSTDGDYLPTPPLVDRDVSPQVLTRFTGALATEAEMYRNEVVPRAGIRAPACYFARSDRVTDRVLLRAANSRGRRALRDPLAPPWILSR